MARFRFGYAKGRRRERGTMNKVEKAYAEHLQQRVYVGEVLAWGYEAVKLRLADNTFYTPDFWVLPTTLELTLVDTKGYKKKPNGEPGYWAEEDAKAKLKVAAEMFPFRFVVAYKVPGVGWVEEEV